jgi:hypothetical protein
VKLVALVLTVLLLPAAAWAQGENVEVDPIRCWWRTSAGAVRMGEGFSVGLTCAVIDNDAVQVVPDETRLGPAVIQMAPFEITGGSHPADLRTPDRRFFQYEYNLRIISPDVIGKDVPLPLQIIHYRINSKVSGNAALQGRDQTYLLPPQSVRLLAMVPGDASDIRDTNGESFAEAEKYTFRAGALNIAGITFVTLGSLVTLLTLVGVARRTRRTRASEERVLSDGRVLRAAQQELAAVQRDSEQHGWTDALVSRALSASRIAAGLALGRPATQWRVDGDVLAGDGKLIAGGNWRHRDVMAVSSSATAEELESRLAGLPASAQNGRRELLQPLQSALATFTASQYAREISFDRASLDAALGQAIDAVRSLKSERAWPKPYVRRWLGRGQEAAHHS